MNIDLLDVFTGPGALSGNPLAVVRGGGALATEQMQALTDWLGFSETTFLLAPTDADADYAVRIFCPGRELPFAGHPTLGSAFAWAAAGGTPRRTGVVVQQCGVGLVEVRVAGDNLAFAAPPMRRTDPLSADERAQAAQVAGVDPGAIIDAVHAVNGPNWVLLRLASAEAVLAAQPAAEASLGTDVGLIGPHPAGNDADWELRAFFADAHGRIIEDPVTGSLNAGAACYLFEQGLPTGDYTAAQGRCVGRGGRVRVSRDEADIWIGGRVHLVAQGGEIRAPSPAPS